MRKSKLQKYVTFEIELIKSRFHKRILLLANGMAVGCFKLVEVQKIDHRKRKANELLYVQNPF